MVSKGFADLVSNGFDAEPKENFTESPPNNDDGAGMEANGLVEPNSPGSLANTDSGAESEPELLSCLLSFCFSESSADFSSGLLFDSRTNAGTIVVVSSVLVEKLSAAGAFSAGSCGFGADPPNENELGKLLWIEILASFPPKPKFDSNEAGTGIDTPEAFSDVALDFVISCSGVVGEEGDDLWVSFATATVGSGCLGLGVALNAEMGPRSSIGSSTGFQLGVLENALEPKIGAAGFGGSDAGSFAGSATGAVPKENCVGNVLDGSGSTAVGMFEKLNVRGIEAGSLGLAGSGTGSLAGSPPGAEFPNPPNEKPVGNTGLTWIVPPCPPKLNEVSLGNFGSSIDTALLGITSFSGSEADLDELSDSECESDLDCSGTGCVGFGLVTGSGSIEVLESFLVAGWTLESPNRKAAGNSVGTGMLESEPPKRKSPANCVGSSNEGVDWRFGFCTTSGELDFDSEPWFELELNPENDPLQSDTCTGSGDFVAKGERSSEVS